MGSLAIKSLFVVTAGQQRKGRPGVTCRGAQIVWGGGGCSVKNKGRLCAMWNRVIYMIDFGQC